MAAKNELFQYSIVSALMDGVASTGLPVSTLLQHGDHGLGTFRFMVGEMIVLDGAVFQMKSDGSITWVDAAADPTIVAPFAMVTRLSPTVREPDANLPSKEALTEKLSGMLPSARNLYVAFRAEGVFRSVTVRTADGQKEPGERLAAIGARQVTHVFEDAKGTLVGFRSPSYMQGVSVAGDHLHFISEDRTYGGHVLALDTGTGAVDLRAAPISRVNLELPSDDPDFNRAELALDGKGIHAVEG